MEVFKSTFEDWGPSFQISGSTFSRAIKTVFQVTLTFVEIFMSTNFLFFFIPDSVF